MEAYLRKEIKKLEIRYNSLDFNNLDERQKRISTGGRLKAFKDMLNYVVTHNKNNVSEIGIDPILSAKSKPININENPYEVYKDIYLQLGEVAKLTGFVIIVAKQNETLR